MNWVATAVVLLATVWVVGYVVYAFGPSIAARFVRRPKITGLPRRVGRRRRRRYPRR